MSIISVELDEFSQTQHSCVASMRSRNKLFQHPEAPPHVLFKFLFPVEG